MLLFALAYLGGVLTILSPCILPVLPFVFARSDRPFVKSGLPMLAGMALTFAVVATLAAVGGGWAVQANQAGRIAALVLLGFFGLTLLIPSLSEHVSRPLVGLGNRLSRSDGDGTFVSSFLLGIGTGLLWAPCAGPILGLVLTGAALGGATVGTSLLLLAYGLGAATSLAVALLIGGKVFAVMKRSLGAGEWVRRGLGVAVLAGVAAIALGLDTGLLTRISLAGSGRLEQSLVDKAMPQPEAKAVVAGEALPIEGPMPSLDGAVEWLNSPPLTAESLKGKVVLVDFWTYSCINCLRSLPYIRAWAEKYKDKGLVVIGVHAPEFAFEKDPANVRKAVADMHITYPVALDNNFKIWQAFDNKYWPAHYFIDAKGNIRHHHFGEGGYKESEAVIQQLLAEAGAKDVAKDGGSFVQANGGGAEMPSDQADDVSPETYVGYGRGERFSSPEKVGDGAQQFTAPDTLQLNHWALAGTWTVNEENSTVNAVGGRIVYRFHARDLHLVLGPGPDGKPVRFRVRLDGQAPGVDHGVDTDSDGQGTVTGERLYQLVRQTGDIKDRTFEIEFLDPGAQAYAFTFG